MRDWLICGGLLAALALPGCALDGDRPGRLYAAHPGAYPSPFYDPYYSPPRGYTYGPAPRSFFTFGFSTGKHRHRHGHRRSWRHHHHHHHWHR